MLSASVVAAMSSGWTRSKNGRLVSCSRVHPSVSVQGPPTSARYPSGVARQVRTGAFRKKSPNSVGGTGSGVTDGSRRSGTMPSSMTSSRSVLSMGSSPVSAPLRTNSYKQLRR